MINLLSTFIFGTLTLVTLSIIVIWNVFTISAMRRQINNKLELFGKENDALKKSFSDELMKVFNQLINKAQ